MILFIIVKILDFRSAALMKSLIFSYYDYISLSQSITISSRLFPLCLVLLQPESAPQSVHQPPPEVHLMSRGRDIAITQRRNRPELASLELVGILGAEAEASRAALWLAEELAHAGELLLQRLDARARGSHDRLELRHLALSRVLLEDGPQGGHGRGRGLLPGAAAAVAGSGRDDGVARVELLEEHGLDHEPERHSRVLHRVHQ